MRKLLSALVALIVSAAAVAQTDLFVAPEFVDALDLQVVSCEGDQQTGQVVLTLSATPRAYMLNINISGGWEGRAYTDDGTVFRMRRFKPGNSLAVSDVPHGVPCIFKYAMEGVPALLPAFTSITMPFHVSSDNYNFLVHSGNKGPLQFRNVPIAWRPRVSKTYMRLPFEIMDNFVVTPVSCRGDKATGIVTMEISVLSRLGGESDLEFGRSASNNKAYDVHGNAFEVKRERPQTTKAPSNIPLKYTFTCPFTVGDPVIPALVFEFSFSNDLTNFSCGSNRSDVGNIEIHNLAIDWQ